jgi:hypothetical protein
LYDFSAIEMLPLLLISTVPAFTLLLVAKSATSRPCKLARDLALLALLLARELFSHCAAAPAERRKKTAMRAKPPALPAPPDEQKGSEVPAAAGLPLLDLPELALDRVLEELSPASLAATACVCAALRDRCSAGALWGHHLRRKWGRVLGAAARKEWEAELRARVAATAAPRPARRRSWADSLACAWPFSWIGCRWLRCDAPVAAEPLAPAKSAVPPADTVAALYRALECGEYCFPAQVYNREVLYLLAHLTLHTDHLLHLSCITAHYR